MSHPRTVLALKAKKGQLASKALFDQLMDLIPTLSERVRCFQGELGAWTNGVKLKPPDFELKSSCQPISKQLTKNRKRLRIVIDFSSEANLGNLEKLDDCSHLIRIRLAKDLAALPFKGNNGLYLKIPGSLESLQNIIYDTCLDILTAHTLPRTRHLVKSPLQYGARLSTLKLEFAKREKLQFYGRDLSLFGNNASTFSFAYACRKNGLASDLNDFDLNAYKSLWNNFCRQLLKTEKAESENSIRLIDLPYNRLYEDWISCDEEFVQKMVKAWGGFREFETLDEAREAILSIPHIAGQISARELTKQLLRITEQFNNGEDLAFFMSYRRPDDNAVKERIRIFFKKTIWVQKMTYVGLFRETLNNSFQAPFVIMLPFRKRVGLK